MNTKKNMFSNFFSASFFYGVFFLFFICFSSVAQTHEYTFNNNLNELNGGPALSEVLACSAANGAFGTQTSGTTSGACLTSNSFCFNAGGGLQYSNPGLISNSYTINVFFRFNVLSGYARVIDFSNSTADAGIYLLGNCLNLYPNGNVGTCPYFSTNIYYLVTFVRDGNTNVITVYVDGTLFGTYNDATNIYKPTNNTTPINFFRDDNAVPCEAKPGCVKYISVSPIVASASDVSALWNNITNTIHATAVIPPSISIQSSAGITCSTTTATLSATSSGTAVWNGGSLSNAPNPSTVSAVGTYTVTATDANGCLNHDSITIASNTTPPTVTANSSGNIGCSSGSVTLTGNSSGSNMVWNGGVLVNAVNPATVSSAGTYTVTATDNVNGCTATQSVSVSTDTSQALTVTVNSPTICGGQSVTLRASGASSYLWSNGTTLDSLVVTPLADTTFTVTGTTGSCHGTAIAHVTVSSSLLLAVTSDTICEGEIATLIASGATTYTWSAGATASGTNTATASPTSLATYTVTGTTGSCSGTVAATVLVNSKPVALFADTTGCENAAVLFLDSSTTATGVISTYSWNFNDGSASSTASNPMHVFTNAGLYNVELQIANNFGCKDTVVKAIQVFYSPVVSFFHNDVCLGDTVHLLNASTVDPSTSITNYFWAMGDGSPSLTTQNVDHYYSTAGTYQVTLAITSADGCSQAITIDVKVHSLPVAGFSTSNACFPSLTQFNNLSHGFGNDTIVSWLWNFGDGSANDSLNWTPTHSYTGAGNYTVVLIARASILACADTLSDTITVFPKPITNFSKTDVCFGQLVNFVDSSTVTNDIINSWSWGFGDTSSFSTNQNPNHYYNHYGTFAAKLVVGTANGCVDSIQQNVIVHPNPQALFLLSNVCEGDAVNFTNNSIVVPNVSNDILNQWLWTFTDTNTVITNQNFSHLFSTVGSFNLQLLVKTNAGCVDSLSKTIVVNPLPAVNYSALDTSACSPLCTSFQSNLLALGVTIASWSWNFSDGSLVDHTQNPQHCFTNDSSVIVQYSPSLTVVSDSGCVFSLVKNNYVTVNPSPVAAFTVTPSIADVSNAVVALQNTSIGADTSKLNWGDTIAIYILASPSSMHSYADTGVYNLMLITSNTFGCFDTAYQTVIIEPDFTFYIPNSFSPNGDGLNDMFVGNGTFVKEFGMAIFDRWGHLVFESNSIDKPWLGMDTKGVEAPVGTYVYKVEVRDYKLKKHTYRGIVSIMR